MTIFIRSKNNPILKPNKDNEWESRKVYNCGAIYSDNQYHLFYRAVGKDWVSKIGYAVSKDGENFKQFDSPILSPEKESEKRGVEDPRVSKIGDNYFLTYSAYDGMLATLQLAVSRDLKNWQKKGEMIHNWDFKKAEGFLVEWDSARVKAQNNPATKNKWLKAGGIFPEIIDNKYWMLFGDSNIWLANSQDGFYWEPILKPFIRPREGDFFDNVHVEMGPPPIKTDLGWLVLYHGIDNNIFYRIGFFILDLKNPTKILYRSEKPIFEPKEQYELSGIVDISPGGFDAMEKMSKEELTVFIKNSEEKNKMPRVIFCCGAVLIDDYLRIYYGASDSLICTATVKISDVLNF